MLLALGLYWNASWVCLKVFDLQVLPPLSCLALIIGACLTLMGISKSSKFAGVGSAVVVGFDYRGLPCSSEYF